MIFNDKDIEYRTSSTISAFGRMTVVLVNDKLNVWVCVGDRVFTLSEWVIAFHKDTGKKWKEKVYMDGKLLSEQLEKDHELNNKFKLSPALGKEGKPTPMKSARPSSAKKDKSSAKAKSKVSSRRKE